MDSAELYLQRSLSLQSLDRCSGVCEEGNPVEIKCLEPWYKQIMEESLLQGSLRMRVLERRLIFMSGK